MGVDWVYKAAFPDTEQALVSCSGAENCLGGAVDAAADFIRNIGLPQESCQSYTGADTACETTCIDESAETFKISDWYNLAPSEAAIKCDLYNHGPLVALMAAHTDFFYYGSGVYTHAWGEFEGYHAALIIGYDDVEQCFIVKSSFGDAWGEEGYFRIAYGEIESETTFGFWTIAYGDIIPADFPTIDGIPRGTGTFLDIEKKDFLPFSVVSGTVRDRAGGSVAGAIVYKFGTGPIRQLLLTPNLS